MGVMLSCWRAKPSTVEILEKIDKEINILEEFKEKNQRLQKIWVGRLVLYSSTLYIIAFIVVYLWCFPEEWTERLTLALPGFLFPLLVWLIRKFLIWLFCKRTERNSEALESLKIQKKKILEEVMEKETYKNAKLILERFDAGLKKVKKVDDLTFGMPTTPRPGQELRQRTSTQVASTSPNLKQGNPQALPIATPVLQSISAPGGPPEKTSHSVLHLSVQSKQTSTPVMGLHPPGPPLARSILPRERGTVDRIIEYLVGDGPQNRYALICQQCFSHNGMALKEEFEYVAFRCAYCFFLNPARKTRPQAPRLAEFNFERRAHFDSPESVGSPALVHDQTDNEPSEKAEGQSVASLHNTRPDESGKEESAPVEGQLKFDQEEHDEQPKENEMDIEMSKDEESAINTQ
ncbi:endoplasmic reticulum junction formation protein lunapark-like isoform X2 [Narcine bancroftii]|uniref:endoplasmic reticulum junction formation protein lunapark-like isoform X2 n=1 Tax=Narcine bancroftii TaxID=1343680 RepID=UPI0038320ECF